MDDARILNRPQSKNAFKKKVFLFSLFILLLLSARIFFFFYSPFVYDEEEYKTGSISHVMLEGLKLPLFEYQPGDYEGGTLLYGMITAFFFTILGENYFALKCTALFTIIILGAASVIYAQKLGGKRSAWAVAILQIIAAPYLIQVTSLPWGNYAECAALTMLTLLLCHTILFEGSDGWIRILTLGFLCGLGVYIHYGYLITAAVVAVFWMFLRKNWYKELKTWAVFAAALVGFSPWLIYNLTHHFWGLQRINEGLQNSSNGSQFLHFIRRFIFLWIDDLPAGLHMRTSHEVINRLLSYCWVMAAVFSMSVLCVPILKKIIARFRNRSTNDLNLADAFKHNREILPIFYAICYSFIFAFSAYGLFPHPWQGLDPESHAHIFQLYPILILITAVFAGKTNMRAGLSYVPTCILVITGIVGNLYLLDFAHPQFARLASPGYAQNVIYVEIGSKWARSPDEISAILQKLDPDEQRSLVFGEGISLGLFYYKKPNQAFINCRKLPSNLLQYCALGVGCGFTSQHIINDIELDTVYAMTDSDLKLSVRSGMAIGHGWFGRFDHPSVAWAKEIHMPSDLPQEEYDFYKRFLQEQLGMASTKSRK